MATAVEWGDAIALCPQCGKKIKVIVVTDYDTISGPSTDIAGNHYKCSECDIPITYENVV